MIVRDHAYLKAVAEACPFPAAELEAKQLHVTYFSESVDAQRFAEIDREAYLPEEFRLGDRELYLYASRASAAPNSPSTSRSPASTRA